jgi:FkbH-like protein
VASKNDPSIVRKAFERPDLLVKANQVFPIEASWGPKSAAVRRILESWNVGAESIVFVDDSPMELAEVQNSFPEMECLLFPKQDPAACVDLLDRIRDLFGKSSISEEDVLRLNSLRARPTSTKDFLEDAGAEVTFSSLKDASDSRPLELINKTNQFNLNGRRYTEAEWRRYLSDEHSQLLVVSYRDKYGHLGKIAVLGARADNRQVLVDTWVMSCRAFSRRIEHQCLRRLFDGFAAKEISFDFEPTPRNGPIGEFFSGLLNSTPQGRFRLSRQSFDELCPPLFHTVKDNHHE